MRLLIIHGAPAAGKLTVANEIANKTGFKVFHNHLSIDFTKPVFEFGSPIFWELNARFRCEVIAEAARQQIDLTHTFCYIRGDDDQHFQDLIAAAEDNGGEVLLVLLLCSNEGRRKRIGNEARRRIGKLTNPNSIGDQTTPDLRSTLPGRETLIVDTSELSPCEAADRIIDHYGLAQPKDCQAVSPFADSPASDLPGISSSK